VNGKRILLVEDDEFVRQLVEAQLESLGYEVVGVPDACHAIAALTTLPRVDLLMTDVMMPGELDGLGLATRVRERWPALPVLLASGNPENASDARALGAPHLLKPYRLAELERKLSDALASVRGGQA
jgi:CheY-like chemotaxis protein